MTDVAASHAATTRFCARVIGPLMLILGVIIIARMVEVSLILPGILRDGPLMFVTGIFTLIVGLVLFAAHHHWSSITAIFISLLGLGTVARGVILLTAPAILADVASRALSAGPGVGVAGGVSVLLGLWLTYAGWVARRTAPA